ncbi:hypothetical protein WJX73_003372 [Symbiochloris irregularis]|uniref:SPX domain-containing protein n=1 Tax=Symbiochloris irregularis TaxID=706552 RepID=A0AAW1PHG2_9CHLO
MKFGALLRTSAEDVPELQNLFLCYKQLKKKLKRLPARATTGSVDQGMTAEERSFVQTLNADVLHFNDLFIEKEEESVIKLGDLEEQAGAASNSEEIAKALTHAVDLHGQLLLLVHWSILAYTGLVKILKKHHKRTGFPIRAPHLENLLSQPFCSVELLTQLVRKAEDTSQQLATRLRSNGGKVEEVAKGSNSPSSPIGDLILAARNSFQAIAEEAAQNEANEQASSSDESSGDHRQSAVCAVIDEPADVASAPPRSESGVLGDTASKQDKSLSGSAKRVAEEGLQTAVKRRQCMGKAREQV